MAKNKTEIHVTTVFDGELDATDCFMFKHGFYSFLFLTPECLDLPIHHLKHILAI